MKKKNKLNGSEPYISFHIHNETLYGAGFPYPPILPGSFKPECIVKVWQIENLLTCTMGLYK